MATAPQELRCQATDLGQYQMKSELWALILQLWKMIEAIPAPNPNMAVTSTNVGIGAFAGTYTDANGQIFIDAGGDRGNLATAQNQGSIYGKSAATPQTQDLRINSPVRLGWQNPTVAQLPAASAALKGYRAYVTDASVLLTTLNLGTTVVGSGGNCVPVFCNGTNWIIG